MTGSKYDGVFYRVFCVTLLAIAFTFTIILTNVFVDIDGLLDSKERDNKNNHETPKSIKTDLGRGRIIFNLTTDLPETRPELIRETKMLIKPTIDVTSLRNDNNKKNNTNPNEIREVLRFFNNGKAVKFKQDKDEQDIQEKPIIHAIVNNKDAIKSLKATEVSDFTKDNIHIPNSTINNAIKNYLIKNADSANLSKNAPVRKWKRSVKVRNAQVYHTTENDKNKTKTLKNDGEELFVEIETNFDGEGSQGEKKRKLVKDIIQKIQKAIHSDIKHVQIKRKPKKYHLKKRFKGPSDNRERIMIKKMLIPFDTVIRRELTPISKSYPVEAQTQNVYDKSGESWNNIILGSRFISQSKGINSAEMTKVDSRYDKDLTGSMISPRMQKPLNIAEDGMNNFYKPGNLTFYIKDLDGSGFSIGFNQFVGGEPDYESINTITGVSKTYATKYNEEDDKPVSLERNIKYIVNSDLVSREKYEDFNRKDANFNRHKIKRRNVDGNTQDHHSNEYKIIFSNNFVPYSSYQKEIEEKNKKVSFPNQRVKSNTTLKQVPSKITNLMEKTLFYKEFKPSDILSLANLINRKKHAVTIKKHSNTHTRNKSYTYLNSNEVINTIFFQNKQETSRRYKRKVEKIRIKATDDLGNAPVLRNSEENIFLLSDENIFSDYAVIREIPEEAVEVIERPNEELELPAFAYEDDKPHAYGNVFSEKARHNILMSKYPHIFTEEIAKSKEEERESPGNILSKYYEHKKYYEPVKQEHHQNYKRFFNPSTENPDDVHNVQDIVNALSPHTNYKLTVKIFPKNSTACEGFKEIHTSINKSISKNGVIISSQVNVSEISKVEKVNESYTVATETSNTAPSIIEHLKTQQDKIMLKKGRQRIEQQLKNFNKDQPVTESFKEDKPKDLISVRLLTNPVQIMQLTKDEAGQLITSALFKIRDTPRFNELEPQSIDHLRYKNSAPSTYELLLNPISPPQPSQYPSETPPPPPLQSSSPPPSEPFQDYDKMRLINIILNNENLTKTILAKIDINTQMLQTLLQRLTQKFEDDRYRNINEEKNKSKDHLTHKLLYHKQSAPNTEADRNEKHVSIPFVYAYQRSFPLSNTVNVPVASVIYQGHIHANKDLTYLRPKSHVKDNLANDSRFFLDNLDNEFKATPIKSDGIVDKVTVFTGTSMSLRVPSRNLTRF